MIAVATDRLAVTVQTRRMPHGSEFKRIHKAVEHLYYLVLFSTAPDYRGRSETWESWLRIGTDLGVREAPHAVQPADRYVDSLYSGARETRITAAGNGKVLEQVARLLKAVDALLPALAEQSAGERGSAALADATVQAEIAVPLASALRAAHLRGEDSDRLSDLLRQSLVSLTVADVTGISSGRVAASS